MKTIILIWSTVLLVCLAQNSYAQKTRSRTPHVAADTTTKVGSHKAHTMNRKQDSVRKAKAVQTRKSANTNYQTNGNNAPNSTNPGGTNTNNKADDNTGDLNKP